MSLRLEPTVQSVESLVPYRTDDSLLALKLWQIEGMAGKMASMACAFRCTLMDMANK